MRGKLSKSALLCLLCCLTGAFAAELDVDRLTLKGYTTKEVPVYTIYEPIEFVLEMDFGGQELEGNYTLDWSCSGDDGVTQKGQSAATEPVHIQTVLDRPGFVHVHALLRDPDGKAVVNAKGVGEAGKVTFDGGAGVDVEQIHGIPEPPDFDGFWKRQLAKLDELPLAVNYMTEALDLLRSRDILRFPRARRSIPFPPSSVFKAIPPICSRSRAGCPNRRLFLKSTPTAMICSRRTIPRPASSTIRIMWRH